MIKEINDYIIVECINSIRENGPCDIDSLSILSLCKYLNNNSFSRFEKELLMTMGLFFKDIKTDIDDRLFSFYFYKSLIEEEYGDKLTPVQADIKLNVEENNSVMFSAPTSIGKSFLLRNIVLSENGDVIVVVPTRALLNEYIKDLKNELKLRHERSTNVLPFIEKINLAHSTKNIYVLTPERCMELLKIKPNISLFVIDEAQLIDSSQGIRSIKFRAMVNKINNHYKDSKMLFAYPFVENLNQIKESHPLFSNAVCKTYKQRSVGQIYVYETSNKHYHAIHKNGDIMCKNITNPIKETLKNNGRVLIFCEKASIYTGEIYEKANEYISLCKLNCTDSTKQQAEDIINKIEEKIGASNTINSQLVENLHKGIAIHHGSLPHEVRVLIENFVNLGFAQICFSTPTLEQGINLPFDLIYIDSFRNIHNALDLKNLIGRAGRSSMYETFDYGIIVFKSKNKFIEYLNEDYLVDAVSDPNVQEDEKRLKEAIVNDTLDEETNMPSETLEKMSQDEVLDSYSDILKNLFDEEDKIYSEMEKDYEKTLIEKFCNIYKAYLHGREVNDSERKVFFQSVRVMIDRLQKKKFSQIVNERYSYAKKHNWRGLDKFAQLPCKNAGYNDVLKNVDNERYYFDVIVFDTFEHLDKNYNLFLKDVFYAIAYLFREKRGINKRNETLMNLFKYGSDDEKEIMLFRYGFVEEEIEIVKKCIELIDENEIVFNNRINELPDDIKEKCLFYKY